MIPARWFLYTTNESTFSTADFIYVCWELTACHSDVDSFLYWAMNSMVLIM